MIITIVLPVHNGLDFTKNCLESLYNVHKIEVQRATYFLIIVDDGSTDGTSEWIEQHFPQVIILKGNGHLWWSGGINMGMKYAFDKLNADYILWWNNDIDAGKNYFENLIKEAEATGKQTIIGSKIYLAQQKDTIWAMGGLFDIYTGKKEMVGSGQKENDGLQRPVEADWLPGMGTLIHRNICEKIGWIDEKTFPQYHGDSDYTLRAKLNGFKIVVFPSLKIYNDTTHSGLKHQESLKLLIRSLFSIRSNYNISRDFKFYGRFVKSKKAYLVVMNKYIRYIGGFIKWKLLSIFGVER
jgi:GT2 family glycosyltransferase